MKKYIYTEDDFQYLVEEVEDNSNDEFIIKKLRVLRILKDSKIYNLSKIGHEFEVMENKKLGNGNCWNLEEWYLDEDFFDEG